MCSKLLHTQTPKAQEKTDSLTVFVVLLGSARVKALRKMLVKQVLSLSNLNGLATSAGIDSMWEKSEYKRSEESNESDIKDQIFRCINDASKNFIYYAIILLPLGQGNLQMNRRYWLLQPHSVN